MAPVTRTAAHAIRSFTSDDRDVCRGIASGDLDVRAARHIVAHWNPSTDSRRTRRVLDALHRLGTSFTPARLHAGALIWACPAWRMAVHRDARTRLRGHASRREIGAVYELHATLVSSDGLAVAVRSHALLVSASSTAVRLWSSLTHHVHTLGVGAADRSHWTLLGRLAFFLAHCGLGLALVRGIFAMCTHLRRTTTGAGFWKAPHTRRALWRVVLACSGFGYAFGSLTSGEQRIVVLTFTVLAAEPSQRADATARQAMVELMCLVDDEICHEYASAALAVCDVGMHPETGIELIRRRGFLPHIDLIDRAVTALQDVARQPEAAVAVARAMPRNWRVRRRWDNAPRIDECMLHVARVTGDAQTLRCFSGETGAEYGTDEEASDEALSPDGVRACAASLLSCYKARCETARTLVDLESLSSMPIASAADRDAAVARVVQNATSELPVCVITQEPIICKVMDPEGFAFERDAIERWICMHGTHPIRRDRPLRIGDLCVEQN